MFPRSLRGALGPEDVATMTTDVTATAAIAVQNHHFSKIGASDSRGRATERGGAVTSSPGMVVPGGPSAAGSSSGGGVVAGGGACAGAGAAPDNGSAAGSGSGSTGAAPGAVVVAAWAKNRGAAWIADAGRRSPAMTAVAAIRPTGEVPDRAGVPNM